MNKAKYTVKLTRRFKMDYKLAMKRAMRIELLDSIVEKLATGEKLPKEAMDHKLTGNWKDYRECHIAPDWILIYRIQNDVLILTLSRTGTHGDVFGL